MDISKLRKYIPLAAWIITMITVIVVPLKIIGYGYLPKDDALRDAARAVSGKAWPAILVMRDDFTQEANPGWHAILRAVHLNADADTDTLVAFSILVLWLAISFAVLPWLRRPEAWLAVLLAIAVFLPRIVLRMSYGRPFLFAIALAVAVLFLWAREEEDSPPRWPRVLVTTLLVAAAVWIHGTWYLFGLPAVGFVLCGRWRAGLGLGACWVAGSLLGACLTGHPLAYLGQALGIVLGIFGNFSLQRMLVPELAPSDGETGAVILLAGVLFWLWASQSLDRRWLRHPALALAILGWLLGLKVMRFWADWGMPALMVWLVLALQAQFERLFRSDSLQRLLLCTALGLGVFFGTTSDRDNRWTRNLTTEYLTPDVPGVAEWLPEPGGIIYSGEMSVFFQTFFKNPRQPWRYVLGFEPAWMRPEDLATLRHIQWNLGDVRTYEPWIKKMRAEDRLILRASSLGNGNPPAIPALEWHYAVTDLWIGRLPRPTHAVPAAPVKP